MHPVFLQFGTLKIYSYGLFVALGFVAAVRIAAAEMERKGVDRERFYEMGVWVVVAAILGARAFHVAVFWKQYALAPLEALKLWNGGLVFYGGFVGATAAGILYVRRHGIPVLPAADACALGIPLGLAFGRVGCTLAGCCFGKPTESRWAIVFTDPSGLAPLFRPLHPTQIYEALASLAIFGFLYAARERFRTPGMLFWTTLVLYGAARFFLETYRDDPRGFVLGFSESQVVSFVLVAYALASIGHAAWRERKAAAA